MIVYLYGLVLADSAQLVPAHITGIAGTAVRIVGCEGGALGAIVSTLEHPPQRSSLDDIRAHDHVLQSVVHHGSTAAAVRFGQTFGSDEEIRRHVAERGERAARILEKSAGCVEMRLLVSELPEPEPANAGTTEAMGPGRTYLEGLRSTGSRAGERLKRLGLRAAIGPAVLAERVEELPAGRGVALSHLIRRADESAYREAIAALPALAEARVVGPLALYSFAEPE